MCYRCDASAVVTIYLVPTPGSDSKLTGMIEVDKAATVLFDRDQLVRLAHSMLYAEVNGEDMLISPDGHIVERGEGG